VHYEERDRVAVIRMDDGKVNALSPAMLEALDAAFDRAEDEARAVVLLGRDGRFSAGFDLKVMMSGIDPLRELVGAGCELLMRIYEFPLPVIVGCTGHALAAGVLLCATGDLRIGVRGSFQIGLNELTKSMPVPIFAQELARDRLDPRHLTIATLGGRIYDPPGALQVGWLDEVVGAHELEARVMEAAREFTRLSGVAFATTKRTLRHQTIDHVRKTIKENLNEFAVGR